MSDAQESPNKMNLYTTRCQVISLLLGQKSPQSSVYRLFHHALLERQVFRIIFEFLPRFETSSVGQYVDNAIIRDHMDAKRWLQEAVDAAQRAYQHKLDEYKAADIVRQQTIEADKLIYQQKLAEIATQAKEVEDLYWLQSNILDRYEKAECHVSEEQKVQLFEAQKMCTVCRSLSENDTYHQTVFANNKIYCDRHGKFVNHRQVHPRRMPQCLDCCLLYCYARSDDLPENEICDKCACDDEWGYHYYLGL